MADYDTTFGNTRDQLTATLLQDGSAINLSGATIELRLLDTAPGSTLETFAMTILSASAGTVTYDWSNGWPTGGDGDYIAQYAITHSDSSVQMVPNGEDRYRFRIWPSL